jgi:peptidyl-tRNA hydrolase
MNEPRLYIVMRDDLWDMNPGKGMAQAAHAQADFTQNVLTSRDDQYKAAHTAWCEDRTFGTTIVLKAKYENFAEIEYNTRRAGIVQDPTYPYRNWYGDVFVRREVTCMWVFAYTEADIEYMKQFDLHQ